MASSSSLSSSSHRRNEEHDAFSGIEPHGKRRNVDESSRLFDVFINHRGPDVKQAVALQLYNSLKELEIRAFLDSEEKELGDSFPSTIENAIHSASAHIAIFSKGYAESPWCLTELLLMLQSRAKMIPLFYEVKPSDLRFLEKGVYAKAFTQYEKKERYMEKLREWKGALQSVSFTTGYEINSNFNISDCQKIVSAAQKEVQRTKTLHVAKYPVGLHRLVQDFERQCLDQLVEDFERQCRTNEGGKEKIQIVGIFGIGGVGKTTLAKELFNRKLSQYTRACFLFDVREAYANRSFPSLQMKLLKDLYQQDNLNFHCIEEGTSHIGRCIKRSKQLSFLIVLDDIDHEQQLDALLILDMLKKSVDSLVIVTTRDVGVLISAGITTAYNVKGMDRGDARELFCWHAFGQSHLVNDYQELVNSFLDVCGGLPLSLQVLGSHVRGRNENYWRLELNKVSKALPRDIHQRLKISFDALDYEEQQIFMDIACFFVDKLKSIAMEVWEASGYSAEHVLETLKNKCLVQELEERSVLKMHDCLRDMGREMANGLSFPHRLWRSQDLKYLESKGFRNILAETKGRCFHSFFDKSMNCQITYFLGGSSVSDDTGTFLFWLQLKYSGFRNHPSIPSWIPLQNLQCLLIRNMWVKTLWQSHVQAHTQSKDLQIYDSCFEEFSDLSGMSNSLEKNLYDLKKLTELNISVCQDLQELGVGHLKNLQKLILHNCYSLKTVSGISDLKKLVELNITHCPVFEHLRLAGQNSLKCITVDHLFKPKCFELVNCRNLKSISGNLSPEKLVSIIIRDCPKLEVLLSFEGLRNLETVAIDGCGKLKSLILSQCQNLERVTGKWGLTCLERINIHGCAKLNCLQLFECQNLKVVSISDCSELEELPCFARQTCLEMIRIDRCEKLQNITLPTTLVDLRIAHCRELKTVKASCVARLRCLKRITIASCGKLQNITLPTTLEELEIEECRELKTVTVICDGCECFELQDLSRFARLRCLKRITIARCKKLQTIQGIDEQHAMESLRLSDCPLLEEVPFSARQTCFEEIGIIRCEKLQNITLPAKLGELHIQECRELKTVAVSCHGCECLELQELPSSPRQTRLAKIIIVRCEKLQMVILPTKVVELTIELCRELKVVAVICHRFKCPELQELSSVGRLSCLKWISIQACEELQTIQGIDELHAIESVQLSYCSNAAIRNWNSMLKIVPSKSLLVVGREVFGALSALWPSILSRIYSFRELMVNLEAFNPFIICADVSGSRTMEMNNIENNLKWNLDSDLEYDHRDPEYDRRYKNIFNAGPSKYKVPPGEWTITIVITDGMKMSGQRCSRIKEILGGGSAFTAGRMASVEKGLEWQIPYISHKIIDRLYC